MFGICYILNYLKNIFKVANGIISFLLFPTFAFACGAIGYWFVFIDSAAPVARTVEWYISIAYVVLFAIIGVCLASVFNTSFKESIEDSDFDLFYVFEIYSNTYKNYSNKKSYDKQNEFRQDKHNEGNEYFTVFSNATTFDEVKKIYRKLAKEVHPDVSNLPKEEACKRMADLNAAYEYYENKYNETICK
ncbi:MAG: DnaJ domain-containing protein [Clostridia bacterium]|nr:DnaJ domain-containing protein [Clostridia bacterium]